MANRRTNQFRNQFENGTLEYMLHASVDSSGDLTLVSPLNKGVTAITHDDDGKYTILFQDSNYLFISMDIVSIVSTVSAAPILNVVSEDVQSAKTVTFQLSDAANAPTDPADGEILCIRVLVRQTSV